ncbi:MAG: hypothetical protein QNK19_00185 [Xanthomonadales bacterium]|nr:hypothetical protein [Xanthomonadales bacterium]
MISKSTLDNGVTEVIIFTRYPEAGTTKTRLIALLGSEKAASLQRAMTEKLFAAAEAIPVTLGSRLTIYFNGGSKALMAGSVIIDIKNSRVRILETRWNMPSAKFLKPVQNKPSW